MDPMDLNAWHPSRAGPSRLKNQLPLKVGHEWPCKFLSLRDPKNPLEGYSIEGYIYIINMMELYCCIYNIYIYTIYIVCFWPWPINDSNLATGSSFTASVTCTCPMCFTFWFLRFGDSEFAHWPMVVPGLLELVWSAAWQSPLVLKVPDPKLKRQPLRKSSFIVGSWPPHKTGWLIDPLLPIIPRSWATKWLQSHPSLPEVSESQNGVQPWNLSWRRWVLRTYASPSFA